MAEQIRGVIEVRPRMFDEDGPYLPLLWLHTFVIWTSDFSERVFGTVAEAGLARDGAPEHLSSAGRELVQSAERLGRVSWIPWSELMGAFDGCNGREDEPWRAIAAAVQGLLSVEVGRWGWPYDVDGVRAVVVVSFD